MTKTTCIYHFPCLDGFASAFLIWQNARDYGKLNDYEFVGMNYGQPCPTELVTDRNVLIVDFSFPLAVMQDIQHRSKSLVVLDHHKTAEENLRQMKERAQDEIRFDMARSGVGMTWDWLNPGVLRPTLVDMIEDRDLGGGIARPAKLPGTREVNMNLFSYEYDFEVWAAIWDEPIENHMAEGVAIDRKHRKDIKELLSLCMTTETIGGHEVYVANMPYTMASDAANIMAAENLFAATWYQNNKNERVYSLRSDENGLDVSEIAKQYGGGGHKHAAGFKLKPKDIG